MDEPIWAIRREGRAWEKGEALPRYQLTPEKMEMFDGRLYHSDEERLTMLALLLENVGIDCAIRLGDPRLWREAIAQFDEGP